MPNNDVEVLDKVLEEASSGRDYTVETEHGEIDFEMGRVTRARRQEFIESLPQEIVEFMNQGADKKKEEHDVDELSSLDDIEDAEPDDAPPGTVMTADAVREMQELIVESLEHDDITAGELRDFMELWSDRQFYATSFLIVAISGEAQGVEGFRTE